MKPYQECQTCPYKDRPGPVEPDGLLGSKFLVIGDSPDHSAIAEGRGLVGAAGAEFWALARAAGISRADCRVTDVVRCLPTGADRGLRDIDPEAIQSCWPLLRKELSNTRLTAVVIPLGDVATSVIAGVNPISRWRGAMMEVRLTDR